MAAMSEEATKEGGERGNMSVVFTDSTDGSRMLFSVIFSYCTEHQQITFLYGFPGAALGPF